MKSPDTYNTCGKCSKVFRTADFLKKHIIEVHGVSSTIECPVGQHKCSSKSDLASHIETCSVENDICITPEALFSDCDVITDVMPSVNSSNSSDTESFKEFLVSHPISREVFNDTDMDPVKKRAIVVSESVDKLIEESGYYPSTDLVTGLLGHLEQVLYQPPYNVADKKILKLSIQRTLRERRRQLPRTGKKCSTKEIIEDEAGQ